MNFTGEDGHPAIFSVREFTEQMRKRLESAFPFVWVRGELSNLSRPASGHIYFSLKDEQAQLQCVWFRGQQHGAAGESFDPLTGEIFQGPQPAEILRNGLEILCAGRITVYAQRGQYQLQVEFVQPSGLGLLAQTFEERKRKLAQLGYFDAERKRPIPKNPRRIALLTSPGGAALHDFLRLASQRGIGAQIRIFPVSVQGQGAAETICTKIREANAQAWADLLVLIRGGGSLEDLWAFNEECLARAILESRLPVLTGIGHEVDLSLADLTADLRAATPSHAAQLLWPLRTELWQRLDDLDQAFERNAKRFLAALFEKLELSEHSLRLLSPLRQVERCAERLEQLGARLRSAVGQWRDKKLHLLEKAEMALSSADPETPLRRGYVLLFDQAHTLVQSVAQVRPGDILQARMADGEIRSTVTEICPKMAGVHGEQ